MSWYEINIPKWKVYAYKVSDYFFCTNSMTLCRIMHLKDLRCKLCVAVYKIYCSSFENIVFIKYHLFLTQHYIDTCCWF